MSSTLSSSSFAAGRVSRIWKKVEAASRCGCEIEDLCQGDKIRTIYDGSVGGANDTIRNQTVERTTAPTVLDGVQALHWLHAAAAEGPPSQGAPGPEREVVKPPPGGRHQGPPESEGPQEGLAVPGGRMVGEQGRHIWHGQCPILLGTPGIYSGSSTHFFGTSSLSMTSCGCFEVRGQSTWRWRCWQHSCPA